MSETTSPANFQETELNRRGHAEIRLKSRTGSFTVIARFETQFNDNMPASLTEPGVNQQTQAHDLLKCASGEVRVEQHGANGHLYDFSDTPTQFREEFVNDTQHWLVENCQITSADVPPVVHSN